MQAKKYPPARTMNLRVYTPPVQERSQIPEIRTGLRHQVKLMRSTSVAIALLGFATVLFLWFMAEPFQSQLTIYDYFVLTVICLGILIVSMVLGLIVHLCANEVEDQIKKLSKEV